MAELHRHRMGPIDLVIVNSDPSGVITAPIGSKVCHIDGREWRNTDGGTTYEVFGSFGNDFQAEISAVRSTTTETTLQTKVAMTTAALTGIFRIGWMAVIDQSSAIYSVEARCYNVTDAAIVAGLAVHEPADVRNRIHVGGFAYISFTGAAKTFEIQYRAFGGGTAGIQEAIIELWRRG